jgi:hypothetical protein
MLFYLNLIIEYFLYYIIVKFIFKMGGCASGGQKDTEIDMYLKKHHKTSNVSTDKNCYEISK